MRTPYAVYKRSEKPWTYTETEKLWKWYGDKTTNRFIVDKLSKYFYDDTANKSFSNCWSLQDINHIKKENILAYEDIFKPKIKFNYCL